MARADVTFQFEIINVELISFLNPIISVIYGRNRAIWEFRVIAASTKIILRETLLNEMKIGTVYSLQL